MPSAAPCQLWWLCRDSYLSGIKEKDELFLLDAPLSPPNLFGDAVSSVVKFQQALAQPLAPLTGSNKKRVLLPVWFSSTKIQRGDVYGSRL